MNNSVADPLSFFQAVHIGALKKRKQTHLVYQEKVFMSDNIKILNSTKDSFLKKIMFSSKFIYLCFLFIFGVFNLKFCPICQNTFKSFRLSKQKANGGNISYFGQYTIHTFTESSSLIINEPILSLEYLVVAGGGGGGHDNAGGGGAGGFQASSTTLSNGAYSITVGAGGAGGSGASRGVNGNNSIFASITSIGGGGGGGESKTGNNGGSGGGGGGFTGSSAGGTGTVGQGNNGGQGNGGSPYQGGGGGGAGSAGTARPGRSR
jgi:hypothetical protein